MTPIPDQRYGSGELRGERVTLVEMRYFPAICHLACIALVFSVHVARARFVQPMVFSFLLVNSAIKR